MTEHREVWSIEDHVCRVCFGRILSSGKTYVCPHCGATGSDKPGAICCCEARFNNGHSMRIRCQPNPARSPLSPAEIVAFQHDGPPDPPKPKPEPKTKPRRRKRPGQGDMFGAQ